MSDAELFANRSALFTNGGEFRYAPFLHDQLTFADISGTDTLAGLKLYTRTPIEHTSGS
jgi:hypothetical protein